MPHPGFIRAHWPLHAIGLALAVAYSVLFVAPFFLPTVSISDLPGPPRGEVFQFALSHAGPLVRIVYAIAITSICGAYGAAWTLCGGRKETRHLAATVFGWAIVFGLLFLLMQPSMTTDLYDYAFRGRQVLDHGLNPLVVRPNSTPDDPWVRLLAWPNLPSPYGPFWLVIEMVAYTFGSGELIGTLVNLKLVGLVATLGIAAIVWQILAAATPQQRATGVLLFAWNPLMLVDGIGNAHNDMAMMAVVLLALVLIQANRWAIALPILAAALLVKAAAIIIVPLVLLVAFQKWTRHAIRASSLIIGCVLSLALIVAAYAWAWAGPATLLHITTAAQQYALINSPAYTIMWGLRRFALADPGHSIPILRLAGSCLFGVLYVFVARRLWRNPLTLMTAIFDVTFIMLLVGAGWFWPWYIIWLLPLAALVSDRRRQVAAMVFSGFALLTYVANSWVLSGAPYFGYSAILLLAFGATATLFLRALWLDFRSEGTATPPFQSAWRARSPSAAHD